LDILDQISKDILEDLFTCNLFLRLLQSWDLAVVVLVVQEAKVAVVLLDGVLALDLVVLEKHHQYSLVLV
tara:strand:+ start:341 stop:550 length:210 start_codon:yes stop_codon:yes gene_type:complete